jgi:hypothetical protein
MEIHMFLLALQELVNMRIVVTSHVQPQGVEQQLAHIQIVDVLAVGQIQVVHVANVNQVVLYQVHSVIQVVQQLMHGLQQQFVQPTVMHLR